MEVSFVSIFKIFGYSVWLGRKPLVVSLALFVVYFLLDNPYFKLAVCIISLVFLLWFVVIYFRYIGATDWKIGFVSGVGLNPPRKGGLYKCVFVRGKYRPIKAIK